PHSLTYHTVLLLLTLSPHSFSPIFFQPSAAHRYLHSFPTRRSSDLTGTTSFSEKMQEQNIPYESRIIYADYASEKEREYYSESRSEEHTSELQSRFDLVCRLLLEKKKKKQKNNSKDHTRKKSSIKMK